MHHGDKERVEAEVFQFVVYKHSTPDPHIFDYQLTQLFKIAHVDLWDMKEFIDLCLNKKKFKRLMTKHLLVQRCEKYYLFSMKSDVNEMVRVVDVKCLNLEPVQSELYYLH